MPISLLLSLSKSQCPDWEIKLLFNELSPLFLDISVFEKNFFSIIEAFGANF